MSFSFGSLPWGDIIKGGMNMFGASKSSDYAKQAGQMATPTPYSVGGPAGGVSFDPRTKQATMSMANNPFASMFNAMAGPMFANAATAGGSFLNGANPELAAAYRGTYGQGFDRNVRQNLSLLRDAARPEERRMDLALDDQLFSRGQMGTTGGAERFRAMQEAHGQADLNRQLSATTMARTEANDRFQNALGSVNQGMAGAQNNFNMGMGAFGGMQQLFGNLMQQGQLGLGAMSGMPSDMAMYQAQARQDPYAAAYGMLDSGGVFDKLNGMFGGGGGTGMVTQPQLGAPTVSAPPPNWMPSGNFGL